MSEVPEYQRREIEELLKELAADPNAKLLRIPPVENLLALAKQPKVGVHAPSLTSIERHLLRAHREELAFLLRERCLMRLFSQAEAERGWHRRIDPETRLDVPVDSDWRRRVGETSSFDTGDDAALEASAVLEASKAAPGAGDPDVAQLAAASLRVSPSAEARTYAAMHMLDKGDFVGARAAHLDVLRSTESSTLISICWENCGLAYYREGSFEQAAKAYHDASMACPSRTSPSVFRLTSALAAGASREARDAAIEVDACVSEDDPILAWAESAVSRLVASRPDLRKRAGRVRIEGPSATTRRLCDAFG